MEVEDESDEEVPVMVEDIMVVWLAESVMLMLMLMELPLDMDIEEVMESDAVLEAEPRYKSQP